MSDIGDSSRGHCLMSCEEWPCVISQLLLPPTTQAQSTTHELPITRHRLPPAILRLMVFSTMLLSSANAALPHENSTRLLEAESTPNWLSLSIVVRPDVNDRPNAGYNMLAVPVLSEGGTKVLYDVSARFDQGRESCIDKSVISYTQTNGYALVVIPSQKEKPTSCLETESGAYMIPRINFILEAVARLEDGDPVAKTPTCNEQYTITLSETDYAVCVTKPGAEMTISGDDDQWR